MDPAILAIIILLITIVLYVTEVIPLPLTSVLGCILMVLSGILEFDEAFSGFSNTVVFLVGGMIFVGNALFETGGAELIGEKVKSLAKKSEKNVLIIVMVVGGLLSAFISNSATTALLISVTFGMAATSGGMIKSQRVLMPIAFSANAGGMLTLVGSTPTLIVQGILIDAGYAPLGFFEFALIGGPVLILTILYMYTIGYNQLDRISKERGEEMEDIIKESAAAYTNNNGNKDTSKRNLTFGIMALCMVLFATEIIPTHLTAVIGGWLVLATGCLNFQTAFKNFDWQTIIVLAGSLGIARGIEVSGAAELMANQILAVDFIDSPLLIMAIFVTIGMLFTQIISNTAATAMLAPIGIYLADGMGVSPYPLLLGLCTLAAAGFVTPVATPPNTMVLVGGYRFTDYIRVGAPLNILAVILVTFLAPLIWTF